MLSFPTHIEPELTNLCNMACIMCPHPLMKRKQGIMPWDIFTKVIDECEGKAKTSYLHQIGEPLLNPNVIPMINYAGAAGIRTSLSTNCMLLDELMAEKILSSTLSEITLCIDSLVPNTYEEIRKGASFQKVIKNVHYLLQRKKERKKDIHVQVQMIKMQENHGEWEVFAKEWQTEGVDEVLIKGYSTFAGRVQKGEPLEDRKRHCNKMQTHITIHWNGDVVPCCRDYEGFEVMGNVKNQSIREIWHSPKYQSFRENFRTSELCRMC